MRNLSNAERESSVWKCIKNYLYKAESVLKMHLDLLDFGTCVAFTVSFEI
jgi:hypothetical protein